MKISLNLAIAPTPHERYALTWAIPTGVLAAAGLVLLSLLALRNFREYRRAHQALGYATVAVHSEADAGAPHVRLADEAVELANRSKFGLGAALWTSDPAKIERLVPRIEAGAVFVNGLVKSDPRLPFGGVKTSGYGRELGLEGIRAFVNVKTVWIK